MDSDANDYVTTGTLLPEAETEITDTQVTDTQVQAHYSPPNNPPVEVEEIVEIEDISTGVSHFSGGDMTEGEISLETDDISETEPPTPDEDIDLVKSLLADLMDEPVEAEVEAALDIETPDIENNDIFDTDIDAIAEEGFLAEELIIPEPAEFLAPEPFVEEEPSAESAEGITAQDADMDIVLEGSEADTALSEIAKSARAAGEADLTETNSEIQSDDIVDISKTDMISKLALLAGTASEADEQQVENEIADLIEPIPAEDEPATPTIEEPAQEDDAMGTPLQKESLIDEETEKDTSSAFASLTSAVAEKSLAEENGPPIGELVKEALKPMLQEWLDNNLKAMVQRAVTKEIKRISSSK